MRRIDEFKGYRSTIEYEPESGAFVTRMLAEDRAELGQDILLATWTRVLSFPELEPKGDASPQRRRRTG
jgi:hypothetical protein